MHFSSATLVLAAALSTAAAHPSVRANHAHLHRAAARSPKFVKYEQPAETTTAAAPAQPSAESGSFYEEKDDDSYDDSASDSSPSPPAGKKEFCSGSKKRATAADISYEGNTGDGEWGCNIMEIDCGSIDQYDYTAEFSSTGGEYSCSAFNKIGPTGDIDGFWHSALDFGVSGSKVCLAFDTDTQGGVACGEGSAGPPKTDIGQFAGTWLEMDAGSGKNGGNSGSDVSTLVADANGGKGTISMSIEAPGKGTCSKLSVKEPHTSHDYYKGGMEAEDGVGCKGYKKGTIFITLGD